MATKETYKIGRLTLNQSSLPSPAEVYEGIGGEFAVRQEEYDEMRDETRVFKEKGRNTFLGDGYDEYSYCHFTYISDTPESVLIRNDDDEEEEDDRRKLETSRILYFNNGQFVFESRRDLHDLWIPKFIGNVTDTELNGDDWRFESLPQEVMKEFYYDHPVISILKVKQPEDENAISGDSMLADAVAELAGRVSSQRYSIGNQTRNNLKGASIIDQSAENFDILEVSGKYENNHTTNLKSTGPIKISWNEKDWSDDTTTGHQAELVRNKLRPFLERLDD